MSAEAAQLLADGLRSLGALIAFGMVMHALLSMARK